MTQKLYSIAWLSIFTIFYIPFPLSAKILNVGTGQTYNNLVAAAAQAQAGDTILFRTGVYTGGQFIDDLQGTAEKWIYILASPGANVIIRGSTEAWHLSDAAYIHIDGFIFEQQTGNGVNIDDSGSYNTPSHHIKIQNCTFRNMNATGNNDLLKLSGVNDFEILNCQFLNGAAGGSGIDMVGCHRGLITQSILEDLGSSGIQAKGGSQFVRIQANFFKNAGARALNLGGSTDLEFFRPIDATFEAADLQIYSNIFIGSQAPIAYVGSVRVEVVNNTFYLPTRWVVRILQETVDTNRFVECGDNRFINNIVYFSNTLSTAVNIGTDTRPETFTFTNNLWYNSQNPTTSTPTLPVVESNAIIGQNPNFKNSNAEDFNLLSNSPAIGKGQSVSAPTTDFSGQAFKQTRSIGALEIVTTTSVNNNNTLPSFTIFPNPSSGIVFINAKEPLVNASIVVISVAGKVVFQKKWNGDAHFSIDLRHLAKGMYYIQLRTTETQTNGMDMKSFCGYCLLLQ